MRLSTDFYMKSNSLLGKVRYFRHFIQVPAHVSLFRNPITERFVKLYKYNGRLLQMFYYIVVIIYKCNKEEKIQIDLWLMCLHISPIIFFQLQTKTVLSMLNYSLYDLLYKILVAPKSFFNRIYCPAIYLPAVSLLSHWEKYFIILHVVQ